MNDIIGFRIYSEESYDRIECEECTLPAKELDNHVERLEAALKSCAKGLYTYSLWDWGWKDSESFIYALLCRNKDTSAACLEGLTLMMWEEEFLCGVAFGYAAIESTVIDKTVEACIELAEDFTDKEDQS